MGEVPENGNLLEQSGRNPSDIINIENFPGVTKALSRKYCCCNKYQVNSLSIFLEHWKVDLTMPLLVGIIFLFSYIVIVWGSFTLVSLLESILSTIIFLIFMILFFIPYFLVIIEGPGYFPFYWSLSEADKNQLPGEENPIAGVVSNEDQYQWVQIQPRPPRSAFFRSAQRYVLQPDHLCGWCASWIGKRNVKFFMLFNLYGSIYTLLYAIWSIRIIIPCFSNVNFPICFFFVIIMLVVAIAFCSMMVSFLIPTIYNSSQNRTRWEMWNQIPPNAFRKETCRENMDEFCGNGPLWRWACPVLPFPGKSTEELAEGYQTYDSIDVYDENNN
ncbi:DHHC zinc finger domain containing protein [Histomonas meleagridis]|uniref:DHHC zinc finger domain containing protein n=1 Tax=Histomonas meleagridis TaxID=135588 RepID=UPI00355981FD|nr:DHHC zinc finger domain containing protein [Histomonas meleagridis]KAH0803642.1 DHHC zinc finger domain containing protein [Histomonas meleagridis]